MRCALFAIVPPGRQQRIFQIVRPSWHKYAEENNIDLIIVERQLAGHVYWDRWMAYNAPETKGYDALALVDNDVVIAPTAPNIFTQSGWDEDRISCANESVQAGWDSSFLHNYNRQHALSTSILYPVHNFGVSLFPRSRASLIGELFSYWKKDIRPKLITSQSSFYITEADGPFLSWNLQDRLELQSLPVPFNNLFPHWYANHVGTSYRNFILLCKLAETLKPYIPKSVWKSLFSTQLSRVKSFVNTSYFAHFAGSKCPMSLI